MSGPQRISGIADAEAPTWLGLLFRLQRRIYGTVLEPTRVWARAPAALRGFIHLFRAVDRAASPLDAGLRSLVMVRVSHLNGCAYCVDINASTLESRGVRLEKALALEEHETSGLFDARERAALRFADQMTRTGSSVDDDAFEALRRQFDDAQIVELTALVALQNASSKFNAALRIPAQGFCPAVSGPRGAAPS